MSENILAVLIGAISAGVFSTLGWFISNYLSKRKEYDTQRRIAAIKHLERQIEEFYGPLLGLIRNSRFVFEVSKKILPMCDDDESYNFGNFENKHFEIYDYFTEKYFLSNNAEIARLINTKLTLLEKEDLPNSFEQFLKHQTQYECVHKLVKKGRDYQLDSFPAKIEDWPIKFESDVKDYLRKYKSEYNVYLKNAIKS